MGRRGYIQRKKGTTNGFNEFFTIPMKGIPETTKGASVRNLVYNFKTLGEEIKKFHLTRGRRGGR